MIDSSTCVTVAACGTAAAPATAEASPADTATAALTAFKAKIDTWNGLVSGGCADVTVGGADGKTTLTGADIIEEANAYYDATAGTFNY